MKKIFGLLALVSLMALVSCGEQAVDTVENAADTTNTVAEQVVDATADAVENAADATVAPVSDAVDAVVAPTTEVQADLPTTDTMMMDDKAMMDKEAVAQ